MEKILNTKEDWIFSIQKVKKKFTKKNKFSYLKLLKRPSVKDINDIYFSDIKIPRSRISIIKGKTGCGKTTLVNMIGLMDEIDFEDDGDIIFSLSKQETINYKELKTSIDIERVRSKYFGFMFQSDYLIDRMTGWENIILPFILKNPKSTQDKAKKQAVQLLEECNFRDILDTNILNRSPSTFSGGQRQRVALIRALMNKPTVIITDEPLASVDSETSQYILKTLSKLTIKGKTVIMVAHDTLEHIYEKKEYDPYSINLQQKSLLRR